MALDKRKFMLYIKAMKKQFLNKLQELVSSSVYGYLALIYIAIALFYWTYHIQGTVTIAF